MIYIFTSLSFIIGFFIISGGKKNNDDLLYGIGWLLFIIGILAIVVEHFI